MCRCRILLEIGDRPGAIMVPVEEGEEGELPEEGLVDSRGERERVAAGAAEPPEGVLGQGGHDGHGGGDQRHPPDQGLEKLERAKGLLLEGGAGANIHDVRVSTTGFIFCPPPAPPAPQQSIRFMLLGPNTIFA